MKITIQRRPMGGLDFYIFEPLKNEGDGVVSLAKPVKLIMKKVDAFSEKFEPTFTIPDDFLGQDIEDSLKDIMKKFNIGDDEHRLKGLLEGKDEHIKYLEGLINKLLEKKP